MACASFPEYQRAARKPSCKAPTTHSSSNSVWAICQSGNWYSRALAKDQRWQQIHPYSDGLWKPISRVCAYENTDSEAIATALLGIFSRLGIPMEILSDQASNFLSTLMKQLYKLLGTKHIKILPYHLQTDGAVENITRCPLALRMSPLLFKGWCTSSLPTHLLCSSLYGYYYYSNTWEEHPDYISGVLQWIRVDGQTGEVPEGVTTIDFLGHISVPECSVAVIRTHKKHITQEDLQSFLGLTGNYRRFIDSYAQHSFHLTNAIRKNKPNPLGRSPDMCCEFSHLCNTLAHSCSLHVHLQFDSFLLQIDGSGREISGILSV